MIFLIIIGFAAYFILPVSFLLRWLWNHDDKIFGYKVNPMVAITTLIAIQVAFYGQLIYWIFM